MLYVTITIMKNGWTLTGRPEVPDSHPVSVYPDREDEQWPSKWAIGPIEVARILTRLGLIVDVKVEPKR